MYDPGHATPRIAGEIQSFRASLERGGSRRSTGSDFILEAATVLFIADLEATFP
jgi:hypothetical protein